MLSSINLDAYLVFVGAAAALILTPGPDTVFVLTQGVSSGKRGGLASAFGVSTGILVHTLAATVGLAALLRASALAYAAVKYAGAAYLAYLGAKTLWSGGEFDGLTDDSDDAIDATDTGDADDADTVDTAAADAGRASVGRETARTVGETDRADLKGGYLRGVTVNVLNPKVALFFLAFLPQFVGSGSEATAEMLALGGTYAALTALYLGGVGLLSGGVRTAFRTRPRLADGLRWVSGSVLVALGAALAFEAR